jgi:hypothetical protein
LSTGADLGRELGVEGDAHQGRNARVVSVAGTDCASDSPLPVLFVILVEKSARMMHLSSGQPNHLVVHGVAYLLVTPQLQESVGRQSEFLADIVVFLNQRLAMLNRTFHHILDIFRVICRFVFYRFLEHVHL